MDITNLTNPAALFGLAILLATGAAIYLAALTAFTLYSLRHPTRRTYAYAVAKNLPGDPAELDNPAQYETIPVPRQLPRQVPRQVPRQAPQNKQHIDAWAIKGDNPKGPAVVLTHGWGASKIDMLSRFEALRTHASRVILWDMPGHGQTSGPCSLGWSEIPELALVIAHAARTAQDNPTPIVLYGYSLGAEVTIKTSNSIALDAVGEIENIAGIILEAPYRRGITPAKAVLRASRFPSLINLPIAMVLNSIRNRAPLNERWHDLTEHTAHLQRPLLVIHGSEDTISPIEDGRAFAACAQGRLAELPGAGHKDIYESPRPELVTSLAEFFADLQSTPTNRPPSD